jgi:hypothetical protein
MRTLARARLTVFLALPALASTCRDYDGHVRARVPLAAAGGSPGEGTSNSAGQGADRAGGAAGGSDAAEPEPARGGAGDSNISKSGGGSAGTSARLRGGHGGAAGGGADDGAGQGGTLGPITGRGGTAGTGGPEEVAAPGSANAWGAVRIAINGVATCAGTLIANSWVLTADHCFDSLASVADVTVGFGSDATHFAETRTGRELVHFDGNTLDVKVRDLALLGVDAPFEIDGSRTHQYVRLTPFHDDYAGLAYVCVGWDLEPDPASDETQLREVTLTASGVSEEDGGRRVWWVNTNPLDPDHGVLLMPRDAGAGCFFLNGPTPILATVHVGNPALRRDGNPNQNDEAYSLSLAAQEIQDWVTRTLFDKMPDVELNLQGVAAVSSPTENEIDLFGLGLEGGIHWYRRNVGTESWAASTTGWNEQPSLPDPPTGKDFATYRPGALCLPDGSVELVVVARDGGLYWQHYDGSAWRPAWVHVTDATSVVNSGVSVIGQRPGEFELFARDADNELRHASYAEGWAGKWESLRSGIVGSPAARMGLPNWFDAFVRDPSVNGIEVVTNNSNYWSSASIMEQTVSEPAVASWGPNHVDSLALDAGSELVSFTYDSFWSTWIVSSGLTAPNNNLAATARGVGSLDVFASGPGVPLWHAVWPREPVATE